MSLSTKITWVLIAVLAVFALAIDRIQGGIFKTRFLQVEQEAAKEDLERVVQGIDDEISDLDGLCKGQATWTPLFDYAKAPTATFSASEFSIQRLKALELDLLFVLQTPPPQESADFLDPRNQLPKVIWSTAIDPDSNTEIELEAFPKQYFAQNHPLLQKTSMNGSTAGLLQTEHRPLLVSAHPITRSNGTLGDSPNGAGVLILGRFIGNNLESVLEDRTRTELQVWQADGRDELSPEIASVLAKVTASAEPYLEDPRNGQLSAYGSFDDVRGRPEILLCATVPCDVTAIGNMAVRSGALTLLSAGGALLLVLLALLKHIVLNPITTLTKHAVRVGNEESYRGRNPLQRNDELGTLSREFDTMLERLDQAKADLMKTARRAGMSEIATGILHNVGNVLNSVNISASLASQQAEEMSVGDLEKLSGVLHAHADDLSVFISQDPQGKHLLPFLDALTGQLSEERSTLRRELVNLGEGVDHICELIRSQQTYAVRTDLHEPVDLSVVLAESIHITEQATRTEDGVDVSMSVEEGLPEIEVDRHRLLEILVNVIQNGRQALLAANTARPQIRLTAKQEQDRLIIHIEDNGPGIPAELLSKVFQLGFTTKPTGMGYGLHTAANAATEMQGKLSVLSGTEGAKFTLDIPFLSTASAA